VVIHRSRLPAPGAYLEEAARALDTLRAHAGQPSPAGSQRRWPIDDAVIAGPEVLDVLLRSFDGKCAYCETPAEGLRAHRHRPPQEALNPDGTVARDHYWFLAYEWENLVPACGECVSHKGQRFPVAGSSRAWGPSSRAELDVERPLLIDPSFDDPERLVHYEDDGRLAGDERAAASADVMGLNRPDLVAQRAAAMDEVRRTIDAAREGLDGEGGTALSEELRVMTADAVPFAGCRRWMLRRALVETDLATALYGPDASAEDACGRLGLGDPVLLREVAHRRFATAAEPSGSGGPDEGPPERPPLGTVRLESITIDDFRAVEHLELRFAPPRSEQEPWLLLLGENGVGKSTALKAVALAFADAETRRRLEPDAGACVRRGDGAPDHGSVTLGFSDGSTATLRCHRRSEEFVLEGTLPPLLVLGYGPTRLPPLPGESSRDPQRVHIANLFDPRAPLRDVEQWLGDVGSVSTRRFNLAATDLASLLPIGEHDRIVRRSGRIHVRHPDRQVSLRELSDGFRSVVALATDLMLHLGSEFESMRSAEALVLLDELEVHLHPSWRMRIVSLLREVFPRLRVIASTHDPLSLQQTEPGEVVVVRRDDDGRVVGEQVDVPKGLRADQLLTGSWFGMASTTDADTVAKVEEHGQLLLQKQTAPVRRRREALEEELRQRMGFFADTSLERLALGVAAELAGQASSQVSSESGRAALREGVLREVRKRRRS
jgi:energy-coupling factor transporter ATP-binding protein EcfA2